MHTYTNRIIHLTHLELITHMRRQRQTRWARCDETETEFALLWDEDHACDLWKHRVVRIVFTGHRQWRGLWCDHWSHTLLILSISHCTRLFSSWPLITSVFRCSCSCFVCFVFLYLPLSINFFLFFFSLSMSSSSHPHFISSLDVFVSLPFRPGSSKSTRRCLHQRPSLA